MCNALVDESDTVCKVCGTVFKEKKVLEKREEINVCQICGAFITGGQKTCPVCGAEIVPLEKGEVKVDEEYIPSIYLCPNCRAFIRADEKKCPMCGQEIGKPLSLKDVSLEAEISVDDVKVVEKEQKPEVYVEPKSISELQVEEDMEESAEDVVVAEGLSPKVLLPHAIALSLSLVFFGITWSTAISMLVLEIALIFHFLYKTALELRNGLKGDVLAVTTLGIAVAATIMASMLIPMLIIPSVALLIALVAMTARKGCACADAYLSLSLACVLGAYAYSPYLAIIAVAPLIHSTYLIITKIFAKPSVSVVESSAARAYNPDKVAALSMVLAGKLEEGLSAIDKAIEAEKDNEMLWNARGYALMKLGRYADAMESFDKALEINPRYAEAWNNKGNLYARQRMYDEALWCYHRALECDPEYIDVLVNMRYVYSRLGWIEDVVDCERKINRMLRLKMAGV